MLALLQFDASSLSLIERLLDEGRLPALAELRRRGQWTSLGRSTPLFVEAGSYVSLYSGREVGDHGIYSAFLWSPEDQAVRFMDDFPAPQATWDALARAGRRSLVIDPYESWPAEAGGRLQLLNGWQFKHKLLLHISRPRGLQSRLALSHGPPPVLEHLYGRQSAARLLAQRPRLLKAPGRAAAAAEELIGSRPDLLWITFSAAHFAGHYYWDVERANGAGLDAAGRRELAATLEDAYEAVDAAIGRVLAVLPEGADVIVFSPIGMGPETSRSDLLPGMLSAIGAGPPGATASEDGDGAGAGSFIWGLRERVPLGLRLALARPLPRVAVRQLTARLHLRGTDWSRTTAFALPGDHAGYVRLNLRGRERHGVVDPGDADGVMDEIADGLRSFEDPDGSRAVADVHRVRDSIDGNRAAQLPDLVVQWPDRPSAGLSHVSSGRFGDVRRRGVGTGRTGNHTPEGWAILAPGASRISAAGRPPLITDVPATVCGLLGADTTGTAGVPLLERP